MKNQFFWHYGENFDFVTGLTDFPLGQFYNPVKKNAFREIVELSAEQICKLNYTLSTVFTIVPIKEGRTADAKNTFGKYKLYRDVIFIDERNDAIETVTNNYELEKKKYNLYCTEETIRNAQLA